MKIETRIIIGPTASGKTSLALRWADTVKSNIINGDSMQVYKEIPILSAAPTDDEKKRCPHALFGTESIVNGMSAGRWATQASEAIKESLEKGLMPIIVGGTGLYIKTLMEGISPIPPISAKSRQEAETYIKENGHQALAIKVYSIDKETTIQKTDTQRLCRSYSVYLETGVPLSQWQKQARIPYSETPITLYKKIPPKDIVYEAINKRVETMVKKGVVEEIDTIRRQPDNYPKEQIEKHVKAIGFKQFWAYCHGSSTLKDAIEKTQQETRHYAKRQYTWLRHQCPQGITITINNAEN